MTLITDVSYVDLKNHTLTLSNFYKNRGNGWLNHIYLEHNVYQYIFYIIYVNKLQDN